MKNLLNCSNHTMGMNQIEELATKGYVLVELSPELKSKWGQLTPDNYVQVCNDVIQFAEENNCSAFHLAGFPAAVNLICLDLNDDIPVFYAYSERQTVEVPKEDGTIEKKATFKHKGFYQYIRNKEQLKQFTK